ncbi:MAG: hypothetical protein JXI33_01250 [Candidatus Aminicenantes bacterium]|nr:hypothetical protein [Candidatus Aminicenantes bacterium]
MGKIGFSISTPWLVMLAVLLACSMAAYGQELELGPAGMHENLRRWGYPEGVPSVNISDLEETPDGYLWLATQEGLVRFNGREFFVFNTANVPVLGHNDIRRLLTTRDGTLWLYSYNGEIVAYHDRTFAMVVDRRLLPSMQVNALHEDLYGRLWIGTRKGPAVIDRGKLVVLGELAPLAGLEIVALASMSGGQLLVATSSSIFRWDQGGLRQIHSEPGVIRDVCADGQNRLWVATEAGLSFVDRGERRQFTTHDGLPDDLVTQVFLDHDGLLWIGTASGIAQIGPDMTIRIVARQATYRQAGIVKAFHQDRRGFVWMATPNSLFRLSRDLFITYDRQKGLGNDLVTANFCDSKNRLWIGTESGLNRLDPEGMMQSIGSPDILKRNTIRALHDDHRGQLWVGTNRGLVRLSSAGSALFTTREGLPSSVIYSLLADRQDRVWVGTALGYCHFDGGRLVKPDPGQALTGEGIFLLFESTAGQIWMGSRTRLFLLRADGPVPVEIPGCSERPIFLSAFEEASGTLWFGTYTDGLYRVRGRQFVRVGESQGLPGNTVYSILNDQFDYLWMSNNRGVFKVSSAELNAVADGASDRLHPILYGQSDGMKATECSGGYSPSAVRTLDGRLAFSTVGGVVIVDPAYQMPVKSPPPVVIENIQVDNREIDPLLPAQFSADVRMIELSFVGLDLQEPENVHYRYRIDGLSSDWHDLGKSGRINLSNPGAGNYIVRIAASTNGRDWSEHSAGFAFTVRTRWYQTRAFILFGFLLAVSAVMLSHRLRIRYLKHRRDILETRVHQRTEDLKLAKESVEQALEQEALARQQLAEKNNELELANQLKTELMGVAAHDLRSPLQLIMGYSELLSLKAGNPDYVRQKALVIQETSERMSQLIHDLLQTSSLEAGNIVLNKTRVDLNQTAQLVAQTYEPFVQQKQQTLQLVNCYKCLVRADEERMREIVDNLVSNAVKYTPLGGSIRVITEGAGGRCRLIIEDEGPGFTEDDRRKIFGKFQKLSARPTGGESSFGLGLAIVKMLVDLHGGEIQVDSKSGVGSRFIVELPTDLSIN